MAACGRVAAFRLAAVMAFASLALSAFNPLLVNETNFTLVQNGTIRTTSGEMRNMHLNVSIPGNHTYQSVRYPGDTAFDSEGNFFARIFEPLPVSPYVYSVSVTGRAAARSTMSLPASYSCPQSLLKYAEPSLKVQSNDARIAAVAALVAANSSDDWERIVKLAEFTNQYIEYDLTLAGQELDALWVLENRRGVCVEYSHLYAALARSQGIPTRVISGYALGHEGLWVGHTWAESYIGDWVPVDPTWLEAGRLDGSHIQVSSSSGDLFETSVDALVERGSHVEVHPETFPGGFAGGVSATGMSEVPPLPVAEFKVAAEQVHFGDETLLLARINSSDYRLAELALYPCQGSGSEVLDVLDGRDRVVALRPGKESVAAWHVRSNPDLPTGFIWSCSVTLASNYFEEASTRISLTPERIVVPDLAADLMRSSVQLGEEQTVYWEVTVAPSGSKVGIVAGSEAGEWSASVGRHAFAYRPTAMGENTVYVYSSKGGVVELKFNVTRGGGLRVRSVEAPMYAVAGRPLSFSAIVENPSLAPASALVTASMDGEEKSVRATIAGVQAINFTLTPPEAGTVLLAVGLDGESISDRFTSVVEVIVPPNVTIGEVRYAFVGSLTTVILNLSASGEPVSMNVSVGGAKTPAQPGEVSLESPPGERLLLVEWLDAAGNYYSISEGILVPANASEIPTPGQAPGGGSGPCAIGLLLFALAGAALLESREFN